MYCPHCSSPNPAFNKFCSSCRRALDGSERTPRQLSKREIESSAVFIKNVCLIWVVVIPVAVVAFAIISWTRTRSIPTGIFAIAGSAWSLFWLEFRVYKKKAARVGL